MIRKTGELATLIVCRLIYVVFASLIVLGCSVITNGDYAYAGAPVVVDIPSAESPTMADLQTTCMIGPDSLHSSETCPVVRWKGHDYWALSYRDNRLEMAIVTRDKSGRPVLVKELRGARYVWGVSVNPDDQTVTFWGQSNRSVGMPWHELKSHMPMFSGLLPHNFRAPGYGERILPTINHYAGKDGGYVAIYTRDSKEAVYSVGNGIYVAGQIRVKGRYIGRIFYPDGYAIGDDITRDPRILRLCHQYFPEFESDIWIGGDTGGWFGIQP